MGWNTSAQIRKNITDPRSEAVHREILENIEDIDKFVQENKRMLMMVSRQLENWSSSGTLNRLRKLKTKLVKENEEMTIHTDVLRQYSILPSEKSQGSQNVQNN